MQRSFSPGQATLMPRSSSGGVCLRPDNFYCRTRRNKYQAKHRNKMLAVQPASKGGSTLLRPNAKATEWGDQYRKPTSRLYPTPLTSPVPREPVSMRLMVRPTRAMIRTTKGKAIRPTRSHGDGHG